MKRCLCILVFVHVPLAAAGEIESYWIGNGTGFDDPASWNGPVPDETITCIFDFDPGAGTSSTRSPLFRRYSSTPSNEATLRGCSAACAVATSQASRIQPKRRRARKRVEVTIGFRSGRVCRQATIPKARHSSVGAPSFEIRRSRRCHCHSPVTWPGQTAGGRSPRGGPQGDWATRGFRRNSDPVREE